VREAHPSPEVAFRVAASPRIGFGHLVRAIHLADALGVPPRVSIRGTNAAAETATRLGAMLVGDRPAGVIGPRLALLVIDDPSRTAALPWLRAARRAGVPVASIHDVGVAPLASDLAVDGSLGARRVDGLGRTAAACRLGPAYAILSPVLARLGRRGRQAAARPRVLVGLGGGEQAAAGLRVARRLRRGLDRRPGLSRARVLLSLGLGSAGRAVARALPAGIDLVSPAAFRGSLAQATVAVVAGGTTLYEACALGTPVVAVPVVPGQATTVRRFVRAGLAAAATRPLAAAGAAGAAGWGEAAARAALDLLADGPRRDELSRRGRRAIDGAGAARVAAAIAALLRTSDRTTTGTTRTGKARMQR
jgi:UDP-2,4-diacetamido-2,4,6-trideoxy-beta-L-altropyranose hydrolase